MRHGVNISNMFYNESLNSIYTKLKETYNGNDGGLVEYEISIVDNKNEYKTLGVVFNDVGDKCNFKYDINGIVVLETYIGNVNLIDSTNHMLCKVRDYLIENDLYIA